jgi:hypothetical protein
MGVLFGLNVRSSGGQVMNNNLSGRVTDFSGSRAPGTASAHSATKDDIQLPDLAHYPPSHNIIHVTRTTDFVVDDVSFSVHILWPMLLKLISSSIGIIRRAEGEGEAKHRPIPGLTSSNNRTTRAR